MFYCQMFLNCSHKNFHCFLKIFVKVPLQRYPLILQINPKSIPCSQNPQPGGTHLFSWDNRLLYYNILLLHCRSFSYIIIFRVSHYIAKCVVPENKRNGNFIYFYLLGVVVNISDKPPVLFIWRSSPREQVAIIINLYF